MARPKLGPGESERLQMVITKEEVAAIETWRYRHRIPSKSEAIRRLCKIALIRDEVGPEIRVQSDAAIQCVMDLMGFVLDGGLKGIDPDKAKKIEDMQAKAFEASYRLYDAQLAEILRIGSLDKGGEGYDLAYELDRESRMRDFLRQASPMTHLSSSPESQALLKAAVAEARRKMERDMELDEAPDNPRNRKLDDHPGEDDAR